MYCSTEPRCRQDANYLNRNWTVSYIKKSDIRISDEPPSAQTEADLTLPTAARDIDNLLQDIAQSPVDDDTGLDLSAAESNIQDQMLDETGQVLHEDDLSLSGSDTYTTASEDERDYWTSSLGTPASESSSVSSHGDRFVSVTEDQPPVLGVENADADDVATEDSLILRTTADDIYLMQVSSSKLVCVASIREVLVGWEDRYSYRGMNRLSMVEWIPELSLAVVVSQMGKVGLVEVSR
jgi:hypothetical protein